MHGHVDDLLGQGFNLDISCWMILSWVFCRYSWNMVRLLHCNEAAGVRSLAIDNMTYVVVALRQPWAIDLQTPQWTVHTLISHLFTGSPYIDNIMVQCWLFLGWPWPPLSTSAPGPGSRCSWDQHQTRDNETNGPFSLIIHK